MFGVVSSRLFQCLEWLVKGGLIHSPEGGGNRVDAGLCTRLLFFRLKLGVMTRFSCCPERGGGVRKVILWWI